MLLSYSVAAVRQNKPSSVIYSACVTVKASFRSMNLQQCFIILFFDVFVVFLLLCFLSSQISLSCSCFSFFEPLAAFERLKFLMNSADF